MHNKKELRRRLNKNEYSKKTYPAGRNIQVFRKKGKFHRKSVCEKEIKAKAKLT